jgi:hypothetical protein
MKRLLSSFNGKKKRSLLGPSFFIIIYNKVKGNKCKIVEQEGLMHKSGGANNRTRTNLRVTKDNNASKGVNNSERQQLSGTHG